MLVNPFLKITNTLRAPHRRAEVQQSKAVSPHPRTMTFPNSSGNFDLQEHIPTKDNIQINCVDLSLVIAISTDRKTDRQVLLKSLCRKKKSLN